MNKILKKIINKTIEREYQNFSETNYVDAVKRSPKDAAYQEECSKEKNSIMQKLNELLPKEHHHLVDEFESASMRFANVDAKIAFKEGLLIGVTELQYLGEVGIELKII